jgi:hypothetical protein
MDPTETGWEGVEWIHFDGRWRAVFENGNELSSSIKVGEVLY